MEIKVTSKRDKVTGEKKVILVRLPGDFDVEDRNCRVYDKAVSELRAYGAYYSPEMGVYSFNPVHRDKVVEICKNLAINAGWDMPNHVQGGQPI